MFNTTLEGKQNRIRNLLKELNAPIMIRSYVRLQSGDCGYADTMARVYPGDYMLITATDILGEEYIIDGIIETVISESEVYI